MANMAYFDGSSYLSGTADIFSAVGTGKYTIKFKVKVGADETDKGIFGVKGNIVGYTHTGNKIYLSQPDIAHGFIPIVGARPDAVIDVYDGKIHDIEIRRVNLVTGSLEFYVDGVLTGADTDDFTNWADCYGNLLTTYTNWFIGKGLIGDSDDGLSSNFSGYISEFELYQDTNLVLYLPLTSDFADHSGNSVAITNTGVTIVDVPQLYTSTTTISAGNQDATYFDMDEDAFYTNVSDSLVGYDLVLIGKATEYGINESDSCLQFPLSSPIPAGATITAAPLEVNGKDIGFGTTFNVRMKLEKSVNPAAFSDLANYNSRKTNLTTAYVDRTTAITQNVYNNIGDLKDALQEVLALGEISSVAVFLMDNGSTDMNAMPFQGAEDDDPHPAKLNISYTYSAPSPTPVIYLSASINDSEKVTLTWTKISGATGYKIYRDGDLIDTLGDVATYDDTFASAPVITPGSATATDGTSADHVALSLSGNSIANGTQHTYTIKAIVDGSDSDASDPAYGYRVAGTLAYQWQRSASDSDASYSDITGGTTASHDDTSAPAGAIRFFKCVLSATGSDSEISTVDAGCRSAVSGSGSGDYPDPANVLEKDTTNGQPGTYKETPVNKVLKDYAYGPASSYLGTLEVVTDLPTPANVLETDTVNGAPGLYHPPTVAEVQAGVAFGASSALTGIFGAAAIGDGSIFGSALAAMLNTDIAKDASYTPTTGAAKSIRVFYNKQDGSLLGLEGYHIWIEALTSDMSAAKPGETVTVEGVTYKIKAPPVHDGDGMSTIELSED
jgi:hypothetical protein